MVNWVAPKPSSRAKTVTGTSNCSPGPITLGSVGNTMSGSRTGAVASALPKLAPEVATAMIRTEPM